MLFKYVNAQTPTTGEDFLDDIVAILAGETNVNNLSANCNKVESGFHANSNNTFTSFTQEATSANTRIIYRANPWKPAVKMWARLTLDGSDNLALDTLEDGTGGVETNPSIANNDNSIANSLLPGKELFIAANDHYFCISDARGDEHALIFYFQNVTPGLLNVLYPVEDANLTHVCQALLGQNQDYRKMYLNNGVPFITTSNPSLSSNVLLSSGLSGSINKFFDGENKAYTKVEKFHSFGTTSSGTTSSYSGLPMYPPIGYITSDSAFGVCLGNVILISGVAHFCVKKSSNIMLVEI